MAIWSFWYIFPVLACCTKKNLATLVGRSRDATYVGFHSEGDQKCFGAKIDKNVKKRQKTSKNVEKRRKTSKNFKKRRKTSENFKKRRKTSKTFLK
jgi:hypothetical protein